MKTNERAEDFIQPSSTARNKWAIVPRVLLIDPTDKIPLIEHKGRLGLFGGHIKNKEIYAMENKNLLDPEVILPTLGREVNEESGKDLTKYLKKATCLGLAEIEVLDLTKTPLETTYNLTPIFIARTPKIHYKRKDIYMSRINAMPKLIYPDAALAFWHIRRNLQRQEYGAIFPDWLNHDRHVIFVKDGAEGFMKIFSQ
jgi:hypothetical protein